MDGIARWDDCRIVVFDIDGTLYDLAPMRLHMAAMVGWQAIATLDPKLFRLISTLRRRREELAEKETADFEAVLVADVAASMGRSEAAIRIALSDWFDRRPLPYLKRYRVPGAQELFLALRQRGIQIGVLSDHRAVDKLTALGLSADLVLSAVDPEIGVQKPHAKGLLTLLDRAGRHPAEAIMIGDRLDRDGAIARRAGTGLLLRGTGPDANFQRFTDPIFHPVLEATPGAL
ncbi:HAD family hydrolase [Devosia faecipullorum]|uniref:HAD family hydrolase n=1 Tax=Devosia faecipullorum TaxID=2755039 RepID=UPI00187B5B95|nr:HAD family hydrolase [Devosia faecipullorum]MBE7731951.1 HAD family hydrolase [Devosia faecipullorum]